MNILITTFSFPSLKLGHYDGKFVLAEAKAYAENGASVKVLTPHFPGVDRMESLQEGIEVIRFPYFWPINWQRLKQPGKPIYDSKSLLALLQIPILLSLFVIHIFRLAKWADIIHAQWTVTALLALPAKFFLKIPIVMTARGSDLRILPAWLNRFIHQHVNGTIDCFGPQPKLSKLKLKFPSNYLKLPLIVDFKSNQTIPPDIENITNQSKDKFIILYIGRYVALKLARNNLFIDLINTAPLLKGRIDFHIFFIGGGEDTIMKKMAEQIVENKSSDCITMLGSKMNVDAYLPWAHLGVGGKSLNAVSQEFIVAGTPQMMPAGDKDIESIWENNRNVLLVTPSDSAAMADKIVSFADSVNFQAKIKKSSSLDLSHYVSSTATGGRKYLTLFADIIRDH